MYFKTMKQLYILCIAILFNSQLNAQTTAGIAGKKNLFGIQSNLWVPGTPMIQMQYRYERLYDYRTNFGFSFNSSRYKRDILGYDNVYSADYAVYKLNDTLFDIYNEGIKGKYDTKINAFEFNIKRFRKKNIMRNYGIYYNYKIGLYRIKAKVSKGTKFDLSYNNNFLRTYTSSEDQYIKFNQLYCGFDLGYSAPFIGTRILFNACASVNAGAVKRFDYDSYRHEFVEFAKEDLSWDIDFSQNVTINMGLSYAF